MPGIQKRFGFTPLPVDKRADNRARYLTESLYKANRLHLNAVAIWRGEVLAHFSRMGAVVNLDREELVLQDPALRGGHNIVIRDDDTLIANGTYGRTVRFYDLRTGGLKQVIDLTAFPIIRTLLDRQNLIYTWRRLRHKVRLYPHTPPRPLFVRGLSPVGRWLFVGVSPAAVLQLDLSQGDLVDFFQYSSNVYVCVHGLCAVDGDPDG